MALEDASDRGIWGRAPGAMQLSNIGVAVLCAGAPASALELDHTEREVGCKFNASEFAVDDELGDRRSASPPLASFDRRYRWYRERSADAEDP